MEYIWIIQNSGSKMVDAFFFFSFKRYQHDVTAIVKYYLCVSKRRDFSKHPLPPPPYKKEEQNLLYLQSLW